MAKGLAVGLNKGHVVSKIEKPSRVKVQRRKRINNYNHSKKASCCYQTGDSRNLRT